MRTRYQYRLLLCDRRDDVYQLIQSHLPNQAEVTYAVERAATLDEALKLLESPRWDLAFCGLPEGAGSSLAFVRLCAQRAPELPLILLADGADPDLDEKAEQAGAADSLALAEVTSSLLVRMVRYTVDRRNWEHGNPQKPPVETGHKNFDNFSQIHQAIIALDAEFKLTAWNNAAEELYGWSAREVLGRPLFDVIRFEAPRAEIARALGSFVRSGTYQIEAAQYRRDGSRITVASSVIALFGAKGNIEGYILHSRDVSEQKRAEDERQQILTDLRSARLRAERLAIEARQRANEMEAIFESMVDAVLIYGSSDQPVRANRAAKQIFGFDPTGADWDHLSRRMLLHDRLGNPIPAAALPFNRALQGESIRSMNYRLTNPAGEVFSLLVSCSPLYTNGQISGAVAVLQDNTELEQLISTLEAERSRLSTIFANMYEAIVLTDAEGTIMLSNPPANLGFFQALFDADHQEYEVLQPNGRPYQSSELPLHRSVTLGESHVNLEMAVRKGDQLRYFLATTAPIVDRKGQISGALGVFQDITQRKQAEEEIRRQMSTTEIQHYLTQYRDREHLNIAYDLHDGPLQTIIGLSFKLTEIGYQVQDDPLHKEITSAYEMTEKVIRDIRAFCNDLRPPTLGRFGLDKTIQSYTEKLRLQNPQIQFRLELEPLRSLSNEARIALFRIYKELIQNVLRHSNASQVDVRLFAEEEIIKMDVHDNGIGFAMPSDWVDLARNGHLGLVGVRERAESIGGQAEVDSMPGEGTSVLVRVPLQQAAHPTAGD